MKWVLGKKLTKQNIQQVSPLFKGQKNSQSYLETEKLVSQTPSYTYTTKEIEEQPEAEQVKTLAVRHPKSKATSSS